MAALTAALVALSAANSASQFFGQRHAATAAEQQGNAQGALFDQNAMLAKAQAADAIARGNQDANGVLRQGRLVGGAQLAAYGAQGLDTSVGSPAAVMANDRALSALDAITIRNNAAREAWGFETEAAGYTAQGAWARASGANEAAAYRRQATGTLLNGAGDLMNIYSNAPKMAGASGGMFVPAPASTARLPRLRGMPQYGFAGSIPGTRP
jgi:hypothetical protein